MSASSQVARTSRPLRPSMPRKLRFIARWRDEILFGGAGVVKLLMITGLICTPKFLAPSAHRRVEVAVAPVVAGTPVAEARYLVVNRELTDAWAEAAMAGQAVTVVRRAECRSGKCETVTIGEPGTKFVFVRSGA